ncbi:MAG: GGDEF domain-containing protein [Acidobacteriota bacterium]
MNAGGSPCILIVDDSPALRAEIRETLRSQNPGATFLEAGDGLEGMRLLTDHQKEVDLVLCDLVMPLMDGFRFLQMRASQPDLEDIPVLILTAVTEVDQKVRLLSAGAQDYIVKPFHPGELLARTAAHLKRKLLEDELKQKNELLLELSTTDGLTRIHNRRHFLELTLEELERSRRMDLQLSLLLFDVDRFKQINDTGGHELGDRVLVAVCQAVKSHLRKYDKFARYGGDEFTVLFPQTAADKALSISRRLGEAVRDLPPGETGGLTVTLSGGVASLTPTIITVDDLIRAADAALYRAKEAGRGRILAAWES